MYQIIEVGQKFAVKNPDGEVFDVAFFRVTNGALFEPIILKNGGFSVCSQDWELIDCDALAGKARALFAKYFPDIEKAQATKTENA